MIRVHDLRCWLLISSMGLGKALFSVSNPSDAAKIGTTEESVIAVVGSTGADGATVGWGWGDDGWGRGGGCNDGCWGPNGARRRRLGAGRRPRRRRLGARRSATTAVGAGAEAAMPVGKIGGGGDNGCGWGCGVTRDWSGVRAAASVGCTVVEAGGERAGGWLEVEGWQRCIEGKESGG
ncbi:hypothetical protein D1007_41524 [Hordeum vulgare]|nr:hypothetical protein D1007_41524 [Hordeum vulgare]